MTVIRSATHRAPFAGPRTGSSITGPRTGPSITGSRAGPPFAGPRAGPSFAGPRTGPSITGSRAGPPFAGPRTGPSFAWPRTGPSITGSRAGPPFAGPRAGPSFAYCYSDRYTSSCIHTLPSLSQLQGLEDSNFLLEHNDVWSCQTPNHKRPETAGMDGIPHPFSKSLLLNVLVEYAVLVSQSWGRLAVGVQEPPKLVHLP